MDGRGHVVEGEVHDLADTVLVDVVHREDLDTVLLEDLLRHCQCRADQCTPGLGLEDGLEPLVERRNVGALQAEEERHGAAVQVARVGRERRVDVGVGVDPDERGVGELALRASDSADSLRRQ
jgi:hypothetical protein